jgi:hypothetical protein
MFENGIYGKGGCLITKFTQLHPVIRVFNGKDGFVRFDK